MDTSLLVHGAVTVGVGALSGGITNAVAIWMLFHPYEPTGIGPFRLQGAIPKSKARLAKSIGRTIGEQLLTERDLADQLGAPAVRQAFDRTIARAVGAVLDQEHGPLRERLHPALAVAVDNAVVTIATRLADQLAAYTRSPGFERAVTLGIARLRDAAGTTTLGATLGDDRRQAFRNVIEHWIDRFTTSDALEHTVRALVTAQAARLAEDRTPLLDRLPPGASDAIAQLAIDHLPAMLEQLAMLLGDPEVRPLIAEALRAAFDQAVRALLLHERLLAKLVVTDRTIERLVDGFEHEGFDRFAAALTDPTVRPRLARAVHEAVTHLLHTPIGDRWRRLAPQHREALVAMAGDAVIRIARDRTTRDAALRVSDELVSRLEQRTWSDILNAVPSAQVARLAAELLDSDQGRRLVTESITHLANYLLARPVGRPADWLGDRVTTELRTGAAEAGWAWVQTQVPRVVAQIRVPEIVEQKVLGFSTARMEAIIREVTEQELKLIVQLGYVLGGLVGLIAFLVNVVLASS